MIVVALARARLRCSGGRAARGVFKSECPCASVRANLPSLPTRRRLRTGRHGPGEGGVSSSQKLGRAASSMYQIEACEGPVAVAPRPRKSPGGKAIIRINSNQDSTRPRGPASERTPTRLSPRRKSLDRVATGASNFATTTRRALSKHAGSSRSMELSSSDFAFRIGRSCHLKSEVRPCIIRPFHSPAAGRPPPEELGLGVGPSGAREHGGPGVGPSRPRAFFLSYPESTKSGGLNFFWVQARRHLLI
jgi:hypothetical protein